MASTAKGTNSTVVEPIKGIIGQNRSLQKQQCNFVYVWQHFQIYSQSKFTMVLHFSTTGYTITIVRTITFISFLIYNRLDLVQNVRNASLQRVKFT